MKNIFTLIAIASSVIFMAQVPNLFSYQAVARNAANQLVTNQNVAVKFSILKSSTNGTVVYAETQNTTTNSNGLFTTNIGTGTVLSGTMNSINWANDIYFVKSEIDLAGGTNYTITGIQQLLSVPYALNAKNGIPSGGTINQVLAKVDGTDYNTQWVTPASGGSSSPKIPLTTSRHCTFRFVQGQGNVNFESYVYPNPTKSSHYLYNPDTFNFTQLTTNDSFFTTPSTGQITIKLINTTTLNLKMDVFEVVLFDTNMGGYTLLAPHTNAGNPTVIASSATIARWPTDTANPSTPINTFGAFPPNVGTVTFTPVANKYYTVRVSKPDETSLGVNEYFTMQIYQD